jgi:hypothetical protein
MKLTIGEICFGFNSVMKNENVTQKNGTVLEKTY